MNVRRGLNLLRRLSVCTCLLAGALFCAPAFAAIQYAITDLGTLGGTTSACSAINSSGHVAGASATIGTTSSRAFLYDGTIHNLGSLGGDSFANGLNDNNWVTGYSFMSGNVGMHAFLYDGTMHDLGTLGGSASEGFAINNDGQVTGRSDRAAGGVGAFLYDGTMHDLGTLGGSNSFGFGINASGQVVGSSDIMGNSAVHAFLWTPTISNGSDGTMSDLGTLGGLSSLAHALNPAAK